MKKYYIVLSILLVIVITFTVLSIVFFVHYKDITKEIVSQELSYSFTGFIPIFQPKEGEEGVEITKQERPDTSALKADSDVALTLGIIFTVIASISLIIFVLGIIKMLEDKKKLSKDTNSSEIEKGHASN